MNLMKPSLVLYRLCSRSQLKSDLVTFVIKTAMK